MYNAAKLAIAGLLAASFASSAFAQTPGASGVTPQAGTGTAGVTAGTDMMNYGEIISSLRTSADATTDIAAVSDTTTVKIILLSELRGNAAENAAALDTALADQEAELDALRSAIDANATLKAKLEAEGHAAEDVVAVSTDADGEVTLIVEG